SILQVCGFGQKMEYSKAVKDLLAKRQAARQNRDWKTADVIRDTLAAMGVPVHDTKVGAR
ncbi:MAG TPA: hypothetical protein VJ943_04495, partial [Desulfotignum sp.]|nr:hypothetical protein [Desulfotignum sp.]